MKVRLFMKSGNQVVITHVEDFSIKYNGDRIKELSVVWEDDVPKKIGVMVGSINLSQIEAIESF